jgi:YHS domain-containing protein
MVRKESTMPDKEKDPVRGANIDAAKAVHEKTGQGDWYFCSDQCRNRFIVNPGRYVTGH